MASSPITVFSSCVGPDTVVSLVLNQCPSATISRDENGIWREITADLQTGWFRRKLILKLTHDPDYYQGPGWAKQQMGMLGYFGRFPIEQERRKHVMATIMSLKFAIGTVVDPDMHTDKADPRFELICQITRELAGCLFVPSALLDCTGRVLIEADGSFDAEAEFPPHEVEQPLDDEFDGELEADPPSAAEVIKRALILASFAARGLIEAAVSEGDAGQAENLPGIVRWIEALGIRDACEPEEWSFICAPVGGVSPQDSVNGSWRLEGLAVLAWSLGLHDLPRYDQMVDVQALLDCVGLCDVESAQSMIDQAQLRPAAEIEELAEQIFGFHWRLVDYSIRPRSMDFVEFVENCSFMSVGSEWAVIADGDLALDGKAISQCAEETVSTCSSIARERHQAVNWLLGRGRVYSEVDVST